MWPPQRQSHHGAFGPSLIMTGKTPAGLGAPRKLGRSRAFSSRTIFLISKIGQLGTAYGDLEPGCIPKKLPTLESLLTVWPGSVILSELVQSDF